ncbi:A24 family peptidase [Candidatus Woesearchaeota archaeon]|nr:A24 family peptidase [Candidatus Woesearchaeota archaeon]
MIDFIIYFIVGIALFIASYTDLKTREVPDWLNYGLIFSGIGLRAVFSISSLDSGYLINGLAGLALMFVVAYAMYYTGQWGGGDSKLLIGLGAFIGFRLESMPTLALFLINLVIVGAFYGLAWSFVLASKNRKAFIRNANILIQKQGVVRAKKLFYALVLILLILLFLTKTIQLPVLFLLIFAILSFYTYIFSKSVEQSCMIKKYPVSKLTEGDWIAEDIFSKGKMICGPRDLGITKKQIASLKRLNISSVKVKEGIAFVPSFLIAYLITLGLGNWLVIFI